MSTPSFEWLKLEDIDNHYLAELFKPKSRVLKVFYVLCFLCSFGFCMYLIVRLLQDYFSYDSFNVVSVTLATEFTLPAITICNVNPFSKRKMESQEVPKPGKGKQTVLDLYYQLSLKFKRRNNKDSIDIDGINDLNIYSEFTTDINSSIVSAVFAKSDLMASRSFVDYYNISYTELGECIEIGDNKKFVQKVEGPIGGLSLILDANVQDYLGTTESVGFAIFLRMEKEAVLNKEFAFFVQPGSEVFVDMSYRRITRLGKPWGDCQNKSDILNPKASGDILSMKECFLIQQLWSFLRNENCRCWPWYFYKRFIDDKKSILYNPQSTEELVNYFVHYVPEDKQLKFNSSCDQEVAKHPQPFYYDKGEVDVVTNQTDIKSCDAKCRNTPTCVLFLYSSKANDVLLESNQCKLFSHKAKKKFVSATENIEGLYTGQVNCTGKIEMCSVSVLSDCENKIIEDRGENRSEYLPPQCHEPCGYMEYPFRLSSAGFPSKPYWDYTLSKAVKKYTDFGDVQRNLVKVNFFTRHLRDEMVVQTKSYEVQNFIAEFGGTTDLLIGISFFTVFQLIELLYSKATKRKRSKPPTDVENNNVIYLNEK